MVRIDAGGLHYKVLNEKIWEAVDSGEKEIVLDNVCGQRYIGAGIKSRDIKIEINGVPGNDLGAFMDGPTIIVNSNCQDGTGNTMNDGKIIINGDCGDILGFSMRGGQIYVKGNAGYRVGIHMKSYKDNFPVLVIGGFVRDFLGEYMAGGILIVLGLEKDRDGKVIGNFVKTGMHGGEIFIRGEIEERQIGEKTEDLLATEEDLLRIEPYVKEYCELFKSDYTEIMNEKFYRLKPLTHRPYGRLYAY